MHQSTTQILGRAEGNEIIKQEQSLMTREGKVKEFDVSIKRQNFRVMKQWTNLRDGQKVIVGIVVSSY